MTFENGPTCSGINCQADKCKWDAGFLTEPLTSARYVSTGIPKGASLDGAQLATIFEGPQIRRLAIINQSDPLALHPV